MPRLTLLVPWLLLVAAGCQKGPAGPALVPVAGTVTLDGKPLSGAQVTLIPTGTTGGQAAVGKTDASGKFAVTTPDLTQQGAAAGSYRVLISKKVNPDGTDFQPSPDQDPALATYKEILPPVYSDDAQTTLTAEVPAGGTSDLRFDLKSKGR
jgi:hypothetical protein